MKKDSALTKERFLAVMLATVGEWTELAESRLRDKETHMIMTPGNDDEFGVDGGE